jgi:4-hydroxyacetophenone monooxygenase
VTLGRVVAPITATDHELRAALVDAEVPPLLPALAHITGDYSLLRADLRIDPRRILEDDAGLTVEQQAAIRAIALDALTRFRDAGSGVAPEPTGDDLARLVQFVTGGVATDHDMAMLGEELALGDTDPRAPQWRKGDLDPGRPFRVAVVGAGMSGIVAAIRLQQAGVPYVVFEKNADVGGTWLENNYPGCRVDVPNHFYSYSFAPRDDWPCYYSPQSELLDYFRACVDDFEIAKNVRVGTEVSSIEYDESSASWTLCLRRADGSEDTHTAEAVVSAVGQLNRPQYASIEGRQRFKGPSFHSAQWDAAVDLRGKRVGVIGTGCSAAQLVPIVAEQAAHLEIFQRTPNWMFFVPRYREAVPAGLRWLLRNVPSYREWYRFWLFWRIAETLRPLAEVDPAWPHQERSVSAANDLLRAVLSESMTAQCADRADLLAKVVPGYPPAAKRIILDDGSWAGALHRSNVTLTTTPIERIVPEGIVTADGQRHLCDVLVHATGFRASEFLTPMKVVGRGGVELHQRWHGDARAYLGVTLPGFPNFYMLYGPNTNIVLNGSIIWFSECQVRYVMDHIRAVLAGGHRGLDCRQQVHDAFNAEVDAGNRRMAWGVSTVNSWYKNANGRVSQNWPFSLLDYWRRTRAVDPLDYEPV